MSLGVLAGRRDERESRRSGHWSADAGDGDDSGVPIILGISSPYARKGLLYDRFTRFYGVPGSSILIWKADTRSMNPTIPAATVTAAYAKDLTSARAEFGGEFRDDVTDCLTRAMIEQCVIRNRIELGFNPRNTYVAFTDPSGGASDSFTLAIGHLEKGVGVLDCVREHKPPFSPESVVQEFSDRLKHFRIHEVQGDRYGAEWVEANNFANAGFRTRRRNNRAANCI